MQIIAYGKNNFSNENFYLLHKYDFFSRKFANVRNFSYLCMQIR